MTGARDTEADQEDLLELELMLASRLPVVCRPGQPDFGTAGQTNFGRRILRGGWPYR